MDEGIKKMLEKYNLKESELKNFLIKNDYKVVIVNNSEVILMDKNNKEVLT